MIFDTFSRLCRLGRVDGPNKCRYFVNGFGIALGVSVWIEYLLYVDLGLYVSNASMCMQTNTNE